MANVAELTADSVATLAVSVDSQAFCDEWQQWCSDMTQNVSRDQPVSSKRKGWTALSHIFCRLAGMTKVAGVKRDASAVAAKLAPAMLQTLHNTDDGSAWEACLRALSAVLSAVPSAMRHHEEALMSATASVLMTPSPAMHADRRQAALCLALLPQVAATSEAWAARMQGLLVTLHAVLDVAMLGLEDRKFVTACRATVNPAAQALAKAAEPTSNGTRSLAPPLRQAGGLLDCLLHLLSRPAAAAPLPLGSLLGVSARILAVDVENAAALGLQSTSVSLLGELAAALPGLHSVALALVAASLRCGGDSAIAHHAAAARLLASQLKRLTVGDAASHWTVRCAVYDSAAEVLQVGGFAATRILAQPAINAAQQELLGTQSNAAAGAASASWRTDQGDGFSSGAVRPAKKRRHHVDTIKKSGRGSDVTELRGPSTMPSAWGSVKERQEEAARREASQLLAAVLRGGVARLPLPLRAQVDALALFCAHTASEAAAAVGQQVGGPTAGAATASLLAALQTLLAAVTAASGFRYPYLPRAMALFRRHAQSSNAELCGWCTLALSSCEAVLHPRAVTLYPPQAPIAAAAAAAIDAASAAATTAAPAAIIPLLPPAEKGRSSSVIPLSKAMAAAIVIPATGASMSTPDLAATLSLPLAAPASASPVAHAATGNTQLLPPVGLREDVVPAVADLQGLQSVPVAQPSQGPSGDVRQHTVQGLPFCSSDSEGSLPDIDSGGSDSEGSSDV